MKYPWESPLKVFRKNRILWLKKDSVRMLKKMQKGRKFHKKIKRKFSIKIKPTLRNKFVMHLVGMYPRNEVLVHQKAPIAPKMNEFNSKQFLSRMETIFKHTLIPSTTNKCKVTPNIYSLNHRHALRADSTKRDDFSETGTK